LSTKQSNEHTQPELEPHRSVVSEIFQFALQMTVPVVANADEACVGLSCVLGPGQRSF
jgi:hypothetical protein